MRRGFLLALLLSANHAFSQGVQSLPPLPANTYTNAVQADASGNIYVGGEFVLNPQDPNAPAHAFVGKLSPDGSQILWWTVLQGSDADQVVAMALGPDNSVYVTGTTSSPDFPTTPGAMQTAESVANQAFAVKLSPKGTVVYSTYIGGSASTTGNAIAVDTAGHAFITGSLSGALPTTPGAITGATSASYNTAFVIELNPAGTAALVAINGFGGDAIALDARGNIYAAGSFAGPLAPTTSGAFQTSSSQLTCDSLGFFGAFPCTYQHIAKIDPTGTQLLYATYVSGTWGATPRGIAVDSSGNAIVAGTTNSPDYPTTGRGYQPEYAASPEPQSAALDFFPPQSAGYVTKLNGSGTGLLWSTFFAGSGCVVVALGSGSCASGDNIAGMAVDANGNILFAGLAYSTDLPGLWMTPVASRPTFTNPLNFVARLSPDGSTLSPTQLLPSSTDAGGLAVRADGTAIFASPLASASFSTLGRVAAIADSADNAKIVSVAPGQLLTLYGTDLAPAEPAYPPNGFPPTFNGVTVTFNDIAAPILYTSATQINLQVPYEIAGQSQVTIEVSSLFVSPAVSESYILAVVERQPSVFVWPGSFSQPVFDAAACNGQSIAGLQPLAFNADGTLNSCTNPAAADSAVTIFLNGLGVTVPAQVTGMVSSSLTAVSPSAAPLYPYQATATVLATDTLPGSVSSLAQVRIQVSSTSSYLNIPLEVQDASTAFLVRGPGILIWVQPESEPRP
jgi:uncharacterized protein (TIGR03437 family)